MLKGIGEFITVILPRLQVSPENTPCHSRAELSTICQRFESNGSSRSQKSARLHHVPWHARVLACVLTMLLFFTSSPSIYALQFNAGLRSSSQAGGGQGSAPSLQSAGAASANLTAGLARQALAKSQAVISGMTKAQADAADAAANNPNNGTVNGLTVVNGLQLTKPAAGSGQLGGLVPYYNTQNPAPSGVANVPNGSIPVPGTWSGVSGLSQNVSGPAASTAPSSATVSITQNEQLAYLYWSSFNVGPKTTVNFDQSAGGANASQWIAFNKVMSSSDPSHIFGNINGQGQVWIQNQNGILFHSGSKVNVQSLVAATLPANTHLTGDPLTGVAGVGVMNNPGYQFLFSALECEPSYQGSDGFSPNTAPGANGSFTASQIGQVMVEPGASITTSVDNTGTGGRVILAGASVVNNGTLSTPNGQAVLAAGLQVGLTPHAQSASIPDPSLRGYDVYVGSVDDGLGTHASATDASGTTVGTVINNGLINVNFGDLAMVGKSVSIGGLNSSSANRYEPYVGVTDFSSTPSVPGSISSATSVSLNGRVDLLSAFNAKILTTSQGYTYDPTYGTTGLITVAPAAVVSILPAYEDPATAPASQLALSAASPVSKLALSSLIDITGQTVSIGSDAEIFAPGALGSPDATAPFYDMTFALRPNIYTSPQQQGKQTPVLSSGITINAGNFINGSFVTGAISSTGPGSTMGSITVGSGAVISAAGSTDVTVSGAQNFLSVQLRGAELANSPLQQASVERGVSLTVDIRNSGTFNGQYWIGTPLGNVNPYIALIGKTVSQLTTDGGTVSMQAGDSVNLAPGSLVNVSGGYVRYSAGNYAQSGLINSFGQFVPMSQATPDQVYTAVVKNPTPSYEPGYLSGGNGGQLQISAPSITLNGQLNGDVVVGMRQVRSTGSQSSLPSPSLLSLAYYGSTSYGSAYQPLVKISAGTSFSPTLTYLDPLAFQDPSIAPNGGGFGALTIQNHDGSIELSEGTVLQLPAGNGSIAPISASLPEAELFIGTGSSVILEAAKITMDANSGIVLPGGAISLTAFDFSYADQGVHGFAPTTGDPFKGRIELGSGAVLSTAGLISQNLMLGGITGPVMNSGGSISLTAWNMVLGAGSLLDVSGGAFVQPGKEAVYGSAGTLSLAFGTDPEIIAGALSGGGLSSAATCLGFSGLGAASGTFNLSSKAFQIGGTSSNPDVTLLSPDVFNQGGFATFNLTGTGIAGTIGAPGTDVETPGIYVAQDAVIHPIIENMVVGPTGSEALFLEPIFMRPAASLSLITTGLTSKDQLNPNVVRGTTLIGSDAVIQLDPSLLLQSASASIPSVKTGSLTIGGNITQIGQGSMLEVPGGTISLSGAAKHPDNWNGSFPTGAFATLTLDPGVSISTAGIDAIIPNPRIIGRVGSVLPGGNVSLKGNILVNPGVVMDVSGTSGLLNVRANGAGIGTPAATLLESPGGTLSLKGYQFLVQQGQLIGSSGGSSASGGSLSVQSGFFDDGNHETDFPFLYLSTALEVSQQTPSGVTSPAHGYFGINSATGFDNLTLGINGYGTMQFDGNVTISAPSSVQLQTVAGIKMNSGASLAVNAPYVSVGDGVAGNTLLLGGLLDPQPSNHGPSVLKPTWGNGSITVNADNIDLGTMSLQGAQALTMNATQAIRGDGAVTVAGSVILNAAQVYPVSECPLQITAFDPTQFGAPGGTASGSIIISGGGAASMPLSACGSLALYASTINQSGYLEAPFGKITLGWNGEGSAPLDPVSGVTVPTCNSLTLGAKSYTSVSGVSPSGTPLIIPYGIAYNGQWVDPAGNIITQSGLPTKSIILSAASISDTEATTIDRGSTVDIGNGGNLVAYQWNSGNQGTINPYSQAAGYWGSRNYAVGTKVIDGGVLYSAISYSSQPQPEPGVGVGWQYYWDKVGSTFAVIPGFSGLTPSSPFVRSSATGNDPGFVSVGYNPDDMPVSNLSPGDSISLAGGGGLAAGTYQLLPSSYGQLPGAYLVISTGTKEDGQAPSVVQQDGLVLSAGQRFNALNPSVTASGVSTMFQILSPAALSARANITTDLASTFLPSTAVANPVSSGGSLQVLASGAVQLAGSVRANGASVILSSELPFHIGGNSAPVDLAPTIELSAKELTSWNADYLFIGGTASVTSKGITANAVSPTITIEDDGVLLSAGDLVLMATSSGGSPSAGGVVLRDNSSLGASGSVAALPIVVNGDGTIIRISSDASAVVTRTGFDTAPVAGYSVGNVVVTSPAGALTLDSSSIGSIADGAIISAGSITLNAGLISANYDGTTESGALNLGPGTLALLRRASSLNLTSYSSIDFHGTTGATPLGSATTAIALHADALIGDGVSGDSITVRGSSILLDNAPGASAAFSRPSTVAPLTQLTLSSESTVTLGVGASEIAGFANVTVNAPTGILLGGTSTTGGALTTDFSLSMNTPFLAGKGNALNSIIAGTQLVPPTLPLSSLSLINLYSPSKPATPGLGASLTMIAPSVSIADGVLLDLPSGSIAISANSPTSAGVIDLVISGTLDVSGQASFQNNASVTTVTTERFTDGGSISLTTACGSISLASSNLKLGGGQDTLGYTGGNAGSLTVLAPNGNAAFSGSISALAPNGVPANFTADLAGPGSGNTLDLTSLEQNLSLWGFTGSQSLRIRSGDVLVGGVTASSYTLSTDRGDITVNGTINASGNTGGCISLFAGNNLVMNSSDAVLDAHGANYNSAGKGGSITLQAGSYATTSSADPNSGFTDLYSSGTLRVDAGTIDLHVATTAGLGQASGTLLLIAPQNSSDTDLNMDPIGVTITGASAINVAGLFRQDAATPGPVIIDDPNNPNNLQVTALNNASAFMANYQSIASRIQGHYGKQIQINPGEEIDNSTGNLVLQNDWDLSLARYGDLATIKYGDLMTALTVATLLPPRRLPQVWPPAENAPGSTLFYEQTTLSGQSVNEPILNSSLQGQLYLMQAGSPVAATLDEINSAFYSGGNLVTLVGGQQQILVDQVGNNIAVNISAANGAPTGSLTDGYQNPIVAADGSQVLIGLIGQSAGYLTFRAAGSVSFQGALSDGFGDSVNNASFATPPPPNQQFPGLAYAPLLPTVVDSKGTHASQNSWSYTITAGADLSALTVASDPNAVLGGRGNDVLIGNPTQNSNQNDQNLQMAALLPGNYEPIRTGTGNITVNSGGGISLLNQFSTIYTAGAQTWDPTMGGSFQVPYPISLGNNRLQSFTPLEPADYGLPQYSYGGGNVVLNAVGDISRLQNNANAPGLVFDTSFQTPNDWISRSGSQVNGAWQTINTGRGDLTFSTSWWINFGNYFEGVATLGGGNLSMCAGGSIRDLDASVATQERTTAAGRMIETGGGDLKVRAAQNIYGGVYYDERGSASIAAGADITSDASRNAQGAFLNGQNAATDPTSWIPTSFLLGQANLSVKAGGSALVGSIANAFLLPVGVVSQFGTKPYFSTFDSTTTVSVTALSGDIDWKTETQGTPDFAINFAGTINANNQISQPWTSTADSSSDANIIHGIQLLPGSISMTSFLGGINLQGNVVMTPTFTGGLCMVAQNGISGVHTYLDANANIISSGTQITISDANPLGIPSVNLPAAQASIDNVSQVASITDSTALAPMVSSLQVTGAIAGNSAPNLQQKLSLHSQVDSSGQTGTLHTGDGTPVQFYSSSGDISGLTLFSPKKTQVIAGGSIENISLYIQNNDPADISMVSAGGNITLYDVNSPSTTRQKGDVQVAGPGSVEVLAGGSLILGNGDVNSDGTGAGIVSIGGAVNPVLQSYTGADVLVSAGVNLTSGLSSGALNLHSLFSKAETLPDAANYYNELIASFSQAGNNGISLGLSSAGSLTGIESSSVLSDEQKARIALQLFFLILRDSGRDHGAPGSKDNNYIAAKAAVEAFLPSSPQEEANIILNSRNIRTKNGGSISILDSTGSIQLATTASSAAAAAAPPGIVTEKGGRVDVYANNNVSLGIGRIFTLRGGDIMIWSEKEDIKAGNSAKSVASAPPTLVLIDPQSGAVLTDLSGLATGGGIGTLQTVKGVPPSDVDLYAPFGIIDAGDAGITSSANLRLGAREIRNADNIAAAGAIAGVASAASSAPAAAAPAAPTAASAPSSVASTAAAAASNSADKTADKGNSNQEDSIPSEYTITIDGYGGSADDEDSKKAANAAVAPVQASL